MTKEIEKIFFDTFGIEPNIRFHCANSQPCAHTGFHCKSCTYHSKDVIYPQITDRILLELIRIIGLITIKYTNEQCEICYSDGAISYLGKNLKDAVLNLLISKVSFFKHQIRTLFEEG